MMKMRKTFFVQKVVLSKEFKFQIAIKQVFKNINGILGGKC